MKQLTQKIDVILIIFVLLKDDQACATCLILICSQDSTDAQTSEWASQAFFAFGGEARLRLGLDQTPAANLGPAFGKSVLIIETVQAILFLFFHFSFFVWSPVLVFAPTISSKYLVKIYPYLFRSSTRNFKVQQIVVKLSCLYMV